MNQVEILQRIRKNALIVKELAELGDNRLLASDGPSGGQRPDLSLKEGLKFDRAAYELACDILNDMVLL